MSENGKPASSEDLGGVKVTFIETKKKEFRAVPESPKGLFDRAIKAGWAFPFKEYGSDPKGAVAEFIGSSVLSAVLVFCFTLFSEAKDMDFTFVSERSGMDNDSLLKALMFMYSYGLITELDFGVGMYFYRLTPDGIKVARELAAIVNSHAKVCGRENFDPFEYVKTLDLKVEGDRFIFSYVTLPKGAVQ